MVPTVLTTSPTLPPELEREIFELAARVDKESALCLMFVAKRAQAWLEPILYSTIILRSTKVAYILLRTLAPSCSGDVSNEQEELIPTPHARTLASYIKTLVLPRIMPISIAEALVPLCPRLQTLACWVLPTSDSAGRLEQLIGNRHKTILASSYSSSTTTHKKPNMVNDTTLTHASINLTTLLGSPTSFILPSTSHALLSQLTHLDIVNHWALWTHGAHPLLSLVNLTHVAFRYWARGSVSSVLERCRKLRVVVLRVEEVVWGAAHEGLRREGVRWVGIGWEGVSRYEVPRYQEGEPLVGRGKDDDIRVVVMRHQGDMDEWERVERGEANMWERAEKALKLNALNGIQQASALPIGSRSGTGEKR